MEGGDGCLACGACCAALRVGFAERETTRFGGAVPTDLTEPWIAGHRRMRGTAGETPRCAALQGTVGVRAPCGIYAARPSPCAELAPGSDACASSRARHGLPPLDP